MKTHVKSVRSVFTLYDNPTVNNGTTVNGVSKGPNGRSIASIAAVSTTLLAAEDRLSREPPPSELMLL